MQGYIYYSHFRERFRNRYRISVKDIYLETVIGRESEYPINGFKGGYWYIRRDKVPQSKANINRVDRDVIGTYANIDGEKRKVIKTFYNINGTLKEG